MAPGATASFMETGIYKNKNDLAIKKRVKTDNRYLIITMFIFLHKNDCFIKLTF